MVDTDDFQYDDVTDHLVKHTREADSAVTAQTGV